MRSNPVKASRGPLYLVGPETAPPVRGQIMALRRLVYTLSILQSATSGFFLAIIVAKVW